MKTLFVLALLLSVSVFTVDADTDIAKNKVLNLLNRVSTTNYKKNYHSSPSFSSKIWLMQPFANW